MAYLSISLMLIAPVLVTLALKIKSLVGVDQAPGNLALAAGVGGLLSLLGNPLFGRLSDRTSSRLGMRRPWMLAGLIGGCFSILLVAVAPGIPTVLAGWCVAQLSFSALQAALVAVRRTRFPSLNEAQSRACTPPASAGAARGAEAPAPSSHQKRFLF